MARFYMHSHEDLPGTASKEELFHVTAIPKNMLNIFTFILDNGAKNLGSQCSSERVIY